MTIREKKGRIEGLRLAIIGDIAHSRVARSNIVGFAKMGASVVVAGPPTMMPNGVEALGASVTYHVDEAIRNADVVMMLRNTERAADTVDFFDRKGIRRGLRPDGPAP